MNAKDMYREFAESEESLPIFSQAWWLDATAGVDNWDVVLATREGQVVASMPYSRTRRYGMDVIGQPPLTQKLGPWLRPFSGRNALRLAYEKSLMQELIDKLPPFDHFAQNWHYTCSNWLPFSWNGFSQTTRYTYVLNDLSDLEKLWTDFENSTRAECKKASNRFRLTIRDDLPLDDFLALNRMSFTRQGKDPPYSNDFVRRLDDACTARGCRKYFIAVDEEGRHHAGNYIVWDRNSSYGLMNGADQRFRNTGGATLCMWAAIQFAATVTRKFDFAGSMIEPVERFFRGFGPTQLPYFSISKTPSRLLQVRQGWFAVKQQLEWARSVTQ